MERHAQPRALARALGVRRSVSRWAETGQNVYKDSSDPFPGSDHFPGSSSISRPTFGQPGRKRQPSPKSSPIAPGARNGAETDIHCAGDSGYVVASLVCTEISVETPIRSVSSCPVMAYHNRWNHSFSKPTVRGRRFLVPTLLRRDPTRKGEKGNSVTWHGATVHLAFG
jgi:hypothetical protein